jgi:hypothetical protein
MTMRRVAAALFCFIAMTAPAAAQEVALATPGLDGTWQVSEVIALADPSLQESVQPGRLLQLGRQSLIALNGAGCAGPTLMSLAEAQARAGGEVSAWLATIETAGVTGGETGIFGFCLGDLFAIYVPQSDGSLVAADRVALYRLQPLGRGSTP